MAVKLDIKGQYMEKLKSLMLTELKAFNKHTYKTIMIKEMKEKLPDVSDTVIVTQCHYISNTLNNESKRLVAERRRPNAQRSQKDKKIWYSTKKVRY